jgi:hypothetical protein
MEQQTTYFPVTAEALERAVENVRDRAKRAARALEEGGVPYAVVGGNAVASWIIRFGKGGARNTRDVDILIRREDFDAAKNALEARGFCHQHVFGVDVFLDGSDALPSESVHLVFANEKVRIDCPFPAPDVTEGEPVGDFRVLSLESLVRMKLTSYRRKDQVHLLDMLGVGLIDQAWCHRLPPELAARLQHLIDTPDG